MSERDLFIAALKITDPVERSAWLDQECGSNAPLRQRLDVLLQAFDKADSLLENPLVGPAAATAEPGEGVAHGNSIEPTTERPGMLIGPYKLLQQIGEGGMGVVYMAEQQQPIRRRVALKIIKPGMDSAQVIARFEAERQALAVMDHQNIAKVLDAGTTDSGRPYFVMELVHGVPITKYCDDNHLTPKQRLELFIPVCHAIQHAHQKGIIHRDLKPSNVLVCLYDGVAVPKVIDFGIAKATGQQLTERTMFTQFGSLVGTLEYMSPEQAEMSQLGIDTRSDVYSLGVLLYELLTGTTPLERHRLREAGFDEIRRLIREEEPPKPSTRLSTSAGEALATISAQRQTEPAKLTRLVRGELDWIVMKALEKDRSRRYETANGLARDLQHYLADEPVEACPPAAGYKLRKFARKHKAGLATAAGFAALLVLGMAVSAWQAVRATQAEAVALAHEQQANANAVQAQEKQQEASQQRDEAQRQRDEVRALNERLQRTLYAAHMNLAKSALDAGAFGRVAQLLERHRPKPGDTELGGFEWYYLYRLCHAGLLTLNGHTARVESVAYSPDGKRLASASWDKTVKVWDAQTGKELLNLQGHTARVARATFSPDGKRLASASEDGTIKVWDAQSGQELLSFPDAPSRSMRSVAFSPDGKRLASGDIGWIRVWDAQTGQELVTHKRQGLSIWDVAFSPDGKRLAIGSPGKTMIWDAETGQDLLTLTFGGGARGKLPTTVAFSPDGRRLASASPDTVKVWDAQTGQELLSLEGGRFSVAFSPDGKRLASAGGPVGQREVKVWDAQTGQELFALKRWSGDILSVAFSPDGKHLAIAGSEVKVWDALVEQKPLTLKAGTTAVLSVALSPDGKRLASASSEVKMWDAETGQELFALSAAAVRCVAFSPDGKRLASASQEGMVKVWDAQTGQELLSLPGHAADVTSVVFSPDGKRLATGTRGFQRQQTPRLGVPYEMVGRVKVWDAESGQELLSLPECTGGVSGLAFSPDSKRLASASREVKVWDAQTGQETLTLNGAGGGVAFSPDGERLVSGGKVWDAQTGQELLTLDGGSAGGATFSADGKRLTGTSFDKTVKVWDAQTGLELLILDGGHSPYAYGAVFSPDGHRLARGAADGTVKIWDATPLPEKPSAKPDSR